MAKKRIKKIKEIKSSPKEIPSEKRNFVQSWSKSILLLTSQSKEKINEIIAKEDTINNKKFMEFLTPSIESIKSLGSEKPRTARSIEQNEEILSFIPKEEDKKEKKEADYSFPSRGPDYTFAKSTKEGIGLPLIKATTLENFRGHASPLDLQRITPLESNQELSNIENKEEKNYFFMEELAATEVKYKPRRFR